MIMIVLYVFDGSASESILHRVSDLLKLRVLGNKHI